MDFKGKLSETYDELCELEKEARKLRNQNLANQIGHSIGRLQMAMSHPDVERVGTDDPDASAGPVDLKPEDPEGDKLPPAPFPGVDAPDDPLPFKA